MPLIESDFLVLVGVDFNLRYCYEIPTLHLLVKSWQGVYNSARFRHGPETPAQAGKPG
jgi:hypothetical protein